MKGRRQREKIKNTVPTKIIVGPGAVLRARLLARPATAAVTLKIKLNTNMLAREVARL